uniref:SET domain-containing protein 4-like n=1 Tax=Crassostrea virginica TaxID=6565 RepID=A0A8B8APH1_CRAVI|nr:SET domain-containing protein 4-like [Crassostrea virginica]
MHHYGRTKRIRRRKQANTGKIVISKEIIALSRWMKHESRKHGFRWKCHLCPSHFSETGRGMMTKQSLSCGDLLVSIPKQLLITVETVLMSAIGGKIKGKNLKLSSQQLLSLFLLQEKSKGVKSFWFPYISVLPKSHDTYGDFSAREMYLSPPKLRAQAQNRITDMKQAYREVLDSSLGEAILYEDFVWAWFCVNSRSVYYRSAGSEFVREDGNNLALAPYLDLLNHSGGAQVEAGYNEKRGCYEIRTLNPYKKYNQVFISYGNHDNYHLLVEYGFTLPENPNDVVQVDYDDVLEAAEAVFVSNMEKKQEVIAQHNLHRKLSCSLEGLSWNLLLMTRVLAMDWTELQHWKSIMTGVPVSDRNEALSRQIAKTVLTKYIQQNRELITKFPEQKSQSAVEKMLFSILQTEERMLQLTWSSVT